MSLCTVYNPRNLKFLGKINFPSGTTDEGIKNGEDKEEDPCILADVASWIVDRDNNAHLDFEKFNLDKKKLDLCFDLGSVTLPHKEEIIRQIGKVPMIYSLGSTLDEDMDIFNVGKSQEMCIDLFEGLGIVSKDSDYFEKFLEVKAPELCAISCPGVKLEEMTSYVILMCAFFILDDIFDNPTDFWTEGLPIYEMTQAVSTFCSIILGQKLPQDVKEGECSGFPKFRPFCELMLILRQEVLALNKPPEESDYFFDSFVEYMDSCAWEFVSWTETKKTKVYSRKSSYFEQRKQTIALLPCLNIIAMIKDVRLSPEIRRDPLFNKLKGKFAQHVVLLNDIFSLKKEIRNGETSNIILLRNMSDPGIVSWTKALQDVRDCIKDIMDIRGKLIQKFPNSKDLIGYFEIGTTWMDANIRWMFLSRRYIDSGFEVDVIDK